MMGKLLHVLMVAASESVILPIVQELRQHYFTVTYARVDNAYDLRNALDTQHWDLIIADDTVHHFSASAVLAIFRNGSLHTPFIVLSEHDDAAAVVIAIKAGAHEFIPRGRYDRAVPTITRELNGNVNGNHNGHKTEQTTTLEIAGDERFRLLLEAAPEAVIITDTIGHILQANTHAETTFGYVQAEMINQPIEMLLPERFRMNHIAYRDNFMDAPSARVMGAGRELWGRRKDGSEFPIEVGLNAVETSAGMNVACFVTDISARHMIEAQLQYQATLLKMISEAIFSTDLDGRIMSWNPGAERIYGWPAAAVIDKKLNDVILTEYINTTEAAALLELNKSGQWQGEVVQQTHDGVPIYVLSSIVFVTDDQGEPTGMVAVNRDITERKRAESALRQSESRFGAIFHRSPVPITITRLADGRTVAVNKAFELLTGFKRTELIGGKALERGLWVDPQQRVELINEVVSQGGVSSREFSLRNRKGDTLLTLISIDLVDLDNGPHLVDIIVDITDHQQMERDLLESERRRLELEAEHEVLTLKERFITLASHEFRTPLAIIASSAELVKFYHDRMSTERQLEHIQEVLTQAGFMTNLLDDVLTVNQAQAGKLVLTLAPINIRTFCESMLERIQAAGDIKHNLIFNCDGDLSNVLQDIKLLNHILINLVNNAIKYSPAGGDVRLDAWSEHGFLFFRVSDEGIGIPPSAFDKLFEPFNRADNVGMIGGTGLGLTIVKESVDVLGGTITCESELDVGTTFTVRIPLKVPDGDTAKLSPR